MLTLSSSFPDPFFMPASSMLWLENVFRQSSSLTNKGQFRLHGVTDCCSNGQVDYLLSFILLQGRAEETNNLCAKLAVGSLFGQYHQATTRDKKNSVRYLMTKQLP